MPTSELSDALNPYYAQPRTRPSETQRPAPQQTAAQHAPHRSELELATSEPPRPPITPPSPAIGHSAGRSNHAHGGGVHAVQELLRFLASTREAQEIERKRRIAWEQEQEAKYRHRQAEMEHCMLEMRQEIAALKACMAFSTPVPSTSVGALVDGHGHPALSQPPQVEYASLFSSSQQPTPSTSPTLSHLSTPAAFSAAVVAQVVGGQSTDGVHDSVQGSSSAAYPGSPLLPPTRAVRARVPSSVGNGREEGSETEEEWNTDRETPPTEYRVRRRNHHDTRCLTIQHAMRNHLLRVMMLDTDKELPDSHVEGTPLGPDEPVRFVWEKTPRQSAHNGRMKEWVLKDLKANRRLYRHVPDAEFGKKMLESVFDQAFVTLRQKFKAQRDDVAARAQKQREEVKAQRARRVSRRKVKLANRMEARKKMGVFEHAMFDGALQIECMSEEESEVESEGGSGARTTQFRVRGVPWRSERLQRFFDLLDEEDRAESTQRPRRGVGRRERHRGPAKEGMVLPPRGAGRWMVSKGWLRGLAARHGAVVGMLGLVEGGPGRAESGVLGGESE